MDYKKRNLGKRFEMLVESSNISYYFQGLAWIEKQEVQKKIVRGQTVYTKKGAPDFMGVVSGGRAVVFDCKSTRGKTLPLKNILDRPHQLQQLSKTHELGGIAFYLVEFVDYDRYFVLTIPELKAFIERETRKSIPIDEFKREVMGCLETKLDYLAPFHLKGGRSHEQERNAL